MKILKRYREPNAEWHETSEEECIIHTEEAGYWKTGTVLQMLADGLVIHTPFAEYQSARRTNAD